MFQKYFMLILCALNIRQQPQCRLNSRLHFHEPLPIFIRDGKLLEPDDRHGTVILNHGETLTISCEGAGNIYHPNIKAQVPTATIACSSEDIFTNEELLTVPSKFSQFICFTPPNYISRGTNRTCYNGNRIYEVGYRVENQFYAVYETCFNENLLTPIYSKYTQRPYNANFQQKVDRPFFKADNAYNYVPVERLFSPYGLKSAIAQRVGSKIEDFITPVHYLSRGHLAAKTDFVFAFGERATFHYVNCAPQWYGFNSGNWNTLEVDLRNHVHNSGYSTIIYTGIYGTLELEDDQNRRTDIYLYSDENNNPVIPIPLYYYKIVYAPELRLGTAFVGINNPYYNQSKIRDLFFCRDVCRSNSDFSWLTWNPDRNLDGYSFCCTVDDFRNTINHLPHFEVRGLLT